MPPFQSDGERVTGTNEISADFPLTDTPAATTNGAPLTGRPTGASGVILYVASGADLTYTIAEGQPGSAPSNTFQIVADDRAWYEPLGDGTNIYITAKTGTVLYRWI